MPFLVCDVKKRVCSPINSHCFNIENAMSNELYGVSYLPHVTPFETEIKRGGVDSIVLTPTS